MNLSDVFGSPVWRRPPPANGERLISPHKLKLRKVDESETSVARLMATGLLKEGDTLVCGSCRARLMRGGKVEEEEAGTVHDSVEAFAARQREGDDSADDDWTQKVYVLNVGLAAFSTRMGVSLAELLRLCQPPLQKSTDH